MNLEAKRQAALRLLDQWKGQNVKRNEWTVQYTGSNLASAAKAKIDFHEGRLKFWEGAKEKVMAEIREEGIEINESIADQLRNSNAYATTQSFGPSVTIRNDLLEKMQEAHGKVGTHEGLIKEYQAWAQMMDAHPTALFQLQHADWMFFFGR
jgi:hypothetical protein